MKKKLLVLLPSLIVLMACGTTQPTTSSVVPPASSDSSVEPISIRGYDLSKTSDSTKAATYDLKTVITLVTYKNITDLQFSSTNSEVATVDNQGVITRTGFGNCSIKIVAAADPSSFLHWATFNISFLPDEALLLGKYDNHLDAPEGKTEVYAVMELKANNTFTLTYTAGTVLVGEESYDVIALSADGTYTVDSLYKFTITTESFPYKKTFSGQMIFDGNKPTLKLKVPVAADKTTSIRYFEKDQ